MVEQHELGELTARLGAPHLEQMTARSGEASRLLVHWGCGCTAIGQSGLRRAEGGLHWSRCGHHAEAEAALP
jgi:hypothetical protein